VNIVAGGKGEGIVSNDNDNDKSAAGGYRQAAGNSTTNISDNSLGQVLTDKGCTIWLYITTTLLIIF